MGGGGRGYFGNLVVQDCHPLARVWQTLETRITRFRDFKCGKIAGSLAPPPLPAKLAS